MVPKSALFSTPLQKPKKGLFILIGAFLKHFYYSFPIQLLVLHLKKNFLLLLIWAFLFGIVTGQFGREFGIPYLFLDPEYLGKVNPISLFLLGFALGIFEMAFQITSYSIQSGRFHFLGYVRRPFLKFFVNNAIIPLVFLIVFLINFVKFQTESESLTLSQILWEAGAFLLGFATVLILFFYYLVGTNKDLFVLIGPSVERQAELKKLKRWNWVNRPEGAVQDSIRVDFYLESPWKIRKVSQKMFFDQDKIQQVFAQNHLNSLILEFGVVVTLLFFGLFSSKEIFQPPAGCSLILFLTILVMITGWASFWFREWTIAAVVIFIFSFNFLTSTIWFPSNQGAFGLNYTQTSDYNLPNMKNLASEANNEKDYRETIQILNRWKKNFPKGTLPKLAVICCSGGGERSAIWSLRNLQTADSLTGGGLMKHTVLMTGASGGMIAAAYYRQLYYQKQNSTLGQAFTKEANVPKLSDHSYGQNLGKDNLNAILFHMVVNDIFFPFRTFFYGGKAYYKDRGYAFEEELNMHTKGILDKPLSFYSNPEKKAEIPLLFLTPTILNDGRKLYISSTPISYMATTDSLWNMDGIRHISGVEFSRFFNKQGADSLRFLTALRMSATFPYISPNVELPSKPRMEVMDAGMNDNFGIGDALKFLYVFRNWIKENTSGVVLVSIRDSPSEKSNTQIRKPPLIEKMASVISRFYGVWQDIQDNGNDYQMVYVRKILDNHLNLIELPYIPDYNIPGNKSRDSISVKIVRGASLSWHLTRFEKEDIENSLRHPGIQLAEKKLKALLLN